MGSHHNSHIDINTFLVDDDDVHVWGMGTRATSTWNVVETRATRSGPVSGDAAGDPTGDAAGDAAGDATTVIHFDATGDAAVRKPKAF